MAEAEDADLAGLTALVRQWDRPRYYATLFAPAAIRADLFALYGFAAEIARIPDLVSDPGLGEIRLQFWCDKLEGLADGGGEGDLPALRALAGVIDRHKLPIAPLLALIDARRTDLYADAPATLGDVEGYLGETQSALFQMAAIVAGSDGPETADVSGHAGVAYGLSRHLAAFAPLRARGRTLLPADLLAAEGLTAGDVFAAPPGEAIARVVARVADTAREHLRLAEHGLRQAPPLRHAIFLPLAVVAPALDRVERLGSAIMETPAGLSDFRSLTWIAFANLRRLRNPPGSPV